MKNIHSIRVVSLCVLLSFCTNGPVYGAETSFDRVSRSTLAPPLSIAPPCEVVRRPDGTFEIVSLSPPDTEVAAGMLLFREKWAWVETMYITGQMLHLANKYEIEDPVVILIPLLKDHLKRRGAVEELFSEGYDIERIEQISEGGRIKEFNIPVNRYGQPAFTLNFSLVEDDSAKSIYGFRLRDGTVVCVDVRMPPGPGEAEISDRSDIGSGTKVSASPEFETEYFERMAIAIRSFNHGPFTDPMAYIWLVMDNAEQVSILSEGQLDISDIAEKADDMAGRIRGLQQDVKMHTRSMEISAIEISVFGKWEEQLKAIADTAAGIERKLVRLSSEWERSASGIPAGKRSEIKGLIKEAGEYSSFVRSIIDNRLRYSKGETERTEQCLSTILENVSERCRVIDSDILPAVEIPGMKVLVDKITISNAIANALINAGHAVRHLDEPEISLSVRYDGGYALVSISDNGYGMRREDIMPGTDGRPAFSSLNFTTKEYGTGLGAAETWYAACDHGWEMEADSSPGRGTTITFKLPVFFDNKKVDGHAAFYTHVNDTAEKALGGYVGDIPLGIFLGDTPDTRLNLRRGLFADTADQVSRVKWISRSDLFRSQFPTEVYEGKVFEIQFVFDSGKWIQSFEAIEVLGRKFVIPVGTDLPEGLLRQILEKALRHWEYSDLPGQEPFLLFPAAHLMAKKERGGASEPHEVLSADIKCSQTMLFYQGLLFPDNSVPKSSIVRSLNSRLRNSGTLLLQLLIEHEMRHEHTGHCDDETECMGRDANRLLSLAREYEIPVVEVGHLLYKEGFIDEVFFGRILRSFHDLTFEEQRSGILYIFDQLEMSPKDAFFLEKGVKFIAGALDSERRETRELGYKKLYEMPPKLKEMAAERVLRYSDPEITDLVQHEDLISKYSKDLDITASVRETIRSIRETSEHYGTEVGAAGLILPRDGTDRLLHYIFDRKKVLPLRDISEWGLDHCESLSEQEDDVLLRDLVETINKKNLCVSMSEHFGKMEFFFTELEDDHKIRFLLGGMPLENIIVPNFDLMDMVDRNRLISLLTEKADPRDMSEQDVVALLKAARESPEKRKQLFRELLLKGIDLVPVRQDWDIVSMPRRMRYTEHYMKKVIKEIERYQNEEVSIIKAHTHPAFEDTNDYGKAMSEKIDIIREKAISLHGRLANIMRYEVLNIKILALDLIKLAGKDDVKATLNCARKLVNAIDKEGAKIVAGIGGNENKNALLNIFREMTSAFRTAESHEDLIFPSKKDLEHTKEWEQGILGREITVNWDHIIPYKAGKDVNIDGETVRGRYYYRLGDSAHDSSDLRSRMARHIEYETDEKIDEGGLDPDKEKSISRQDVCEEHGDFYSQTGVSVEDELARIAKFRELLRILRAKEKERSPGPGNYEKSGIIALGTNWMIGYESGRDLQYEALNPLLTSIARFCHRNGTSLIIGRDEDLPDLISREKGKKGMCPDAKVIMLVGANRDDELPGHVREFVGKDSYTIIGVDSRGIPAKSYIRVMEILNVALLRSEGLEPPRKSEVLKIFPKDEKCPIYIVVPKAAPMEYTQLRYIYDILIHA